MLFGLILTIQLVHYPSFYWVSKDDFSNFEQFHSKRISLIVVPLMLVELIVSFSLLFFAKDELIISLINLSSVILIWISTFFLSVPCHSTLLIKKDDQVIKKLIETNWIRTILWGLRSISLFILIFNKVIRYE